MSQQVRCGSLLSYSGTLWFQYIALLYIR